MRKSTLILLQLFLVTALSAQHSIRIKIDSIPAEPRGYDLFIAGSFNKWNPTDEQYMFKRMGNGGFYIDLKLVAGTYEYKITRGSWREVECNANGKDRVNRVLTVKQDESINISIAGWKDFYTDKALKHTASSNVKIIDTAFYIPQLKRNRKVWIYLPENYSVSKSRYPVIYMQDGQNVFDEATSFAGEWGVDEFLDTTVLKKSIVVVVDNGADKRMNEYSPYNFSLHPDSLKNRKGEGQQYVEFLVKTIKPFIDKKYRTLKESKHTFIAGASMGGLISLYAAIKYPKVFGGAGIFSPSVWICKADILKLITSAGGKVKSKIYFYCGKLESRDMVPDMLAVFQELAVISKSKMTTVIRDDGKHNESTWRKEFPLFYKWIMQ
jgi:predicted alpha/beta superfamily hydrolase